VFADDAGVFDVSRAVEEEDEAEDENIDSEKDTEEAAKMKDTLAGVCCLLLG
jgi:hypothetical protein